jgi:hypothetical protein
MSWTSSWDSRSNGCGVLTGIRIFFFWLARHGATGCSSRRHTEAGKHHGGKQEPQADEAEKNESIVRHVVTSKLAVARLFGSLPARAPRAGFRPDSLAPPPSLLAPARRNFCRGSYFEGARQHLIPSKEPQSGRFSRPRPYRAGLYGEPQFLENRSVFRSL